MMSDQEQSPEPSAPSRRKKVKSEDDLVRNILKMQQLLMKVHKTASLFVCSSKFGLIQHGSDHVMEKFQREADKWDDAFDEDEEELIHDIQLQADPSGDDEEDDPLNELRASLLPIKLPAPIALMKYDELWKFINVEVLKEHWRKGGNAKCVKYGNPEFEPSFWLGDVWGWDNVNKHPRNLTKASYSGPGNMTEFLKTVVRNKLDQLGINHEEWISKHFSEAEKKKRERTRKKSTPSIVEEAEEQQNTGNDNAEDVGGEENQNEDILNDTFTAEANLEAGEGTNTSTNESSSNESGIQTGFRTSSVQDGLTRRRSERQATKRARLERLPSLVEEPNVRRRPDTPPRLLSPLSSDGETTSAQLPKFIPRRKPLAKGKFGNGNFRCPLNVNVGQNLSTNGDFVDMRIPSDLVLQFEMLSKETTDRGHETGGVLAGIHHDDHYQVTHLLIPEQTSASDRWEVQDERQITNFFVYHPELLMLGLIHTHPKMDSFLSSVDLHALHDYARSNKSLVSIVLAPEKKTSPAYCLTDVGFLELSKCKEKGFHRHKNDTALYMEANHATDDYTIDVTVEDFRMKR
jgi:hypothetical protein